MVKKMISTFVLTLVLTSSVYVAKDVSAGYTPLEELLRIKRIELEVLGGKGDYETFKSEMEKITGTAYTLEQLKEVSKIDWKAIRGNYDCDTYVSEMKKINPNVDEEYLKGQYILADPTQSIYS